MSENIKGDIECLIMYFYIKIRNNNLFPYLGINGPYFHIWAYVHWHPSKCESDIFVHTQVIGNIEYKLRVKSPYLFDTPKAKNISISCTVLHINICNFLNHYCDQI